MKALLKGLVIVVVVLVVGLIAAFLARNVIGAAVIRSVASTVLKVKVDVSSVDLQLFNAATLEQLSVGNPEGYKTPNAMVMGKVHVALNVSESNTDKVVVDIVELNDVSVWFLQKDNTNNVSQIMDNLKGDEKGGGGSPVEVLVKKIVITNLKANAALLGDEPSEVGTVERIELDNVSTKGGAGGVTEQLSGKIFEIATQATVNALGKKLPGALADGVGKSLEGAGVMVGEASKAIGQAAEGAGKAIGDATKGLGGILGGDKK